MVQGLEHPPAYGLTLGIEDILAATEILLLVSGASKAGPLRRLLHGEISPQFPASFLKKHSRVTIFCDRAAAKEIS
jgi:6-phosphogluconolactonase/glucosamine-6-phosphate isomerase/deaminase